MATGAAIPPAKADVAAIQSANGPPESWQNFGGPSDSATAGWSFTVGSTRAIVTNLGVYDPSAGGLASAVTVGLWSSTGTLLASVTVPAGTAATSGSYLYVSISPVVLSAGQTYVIGGYYSGGSTDPILFFSTQTIAPDITFMNSVQSTVSLSGSFTFPTIDASVSEGVFGPNFLFSPPVYTASSSGNWADTALWSPNLVPNANDSIATLTLPASGTNSINLGGSSFTVNQLVTSGTGLGAWQLVNGTLIFDGTNPLLANQSTALGTSEIVATNLQLNQTTTFDITNAGAVTQVTGNISGSGGLTKQGLGTLVLSGVNGYTGATVVNGGVLDVEGSITGTSAVTVNAGGVLAGTGLVDPLTTTIASGGTLAPGNGTPGTSLAIDGNLAFASGAVYLIQVSPSTASFATVTGTATLGGATVNAVFANGSYIAKTYTILTASGGVSGTFAPAVVNTNLPAHFHTTLSYDADDAYLNLALNFGIPGGLNRNRQAVGNALTNFFNATGSIPIVYGALSPAALTQVSGELGTSAQQTTFDAMGQFMGVLTDPFLQRSGGAGLTPGASGFAEEDGANAYAARKPSEAFAMFTKAPPATFVPHWSVWGAGFGGSQSTDGNAITGSNNSTSQVFGTAVGADYMVSAYTLAGFALAGGGTNFSVNGLGSGRSDLFQAGAYVRHTEGAAYISAALAYGWQDITTDRVVTAAGIDHLRAEFNANAWSGRMEGGYRFVAPLGGGFGLTPYAAAQVTTFDLPAYAEQAISGSAAFALSYGAHSPTDTRSELGLRSDKSFALDDAVLTLRGRLAWAHDFDPDRAIAATFQALPGASFVVNGAAQAADSALTTASAGLKWSTGWSAAATFEGEFSNVTRSYAGKGVVRYAW
ncbi:MAG TPA: autotransporter domain-containing protein [Bradyrhizobium sp.]|nr:autotransporter domain-containing protein [Bradyrhizobium sp.]